VVIEFGLTTVELASRIMSNRVTTLVVIECGYTSVVLVSCITKMGRRLSVVIECGLTTVELTSQWKWHKMTSMSLSMHNI
jgi:hypothetical protein